MQGWAIGETANKKWRARIRVVGLPFAITKWIEKQDSDIALLNHLVSTWNKKNITNSIEEEINIVEKFIKKFEEKLVENQLPHKFIRLIMNNLVWFGPKRWGPNMLMSQLIDENQSLFKRFEAMKSKLLFDNQEFSSYNTELNKVREEDLGSSDCKDKIIEQDSEDPDKMTKENDGVMWGIDASAKEGVQEVGTVAEQDIDSNDKTARIKLKYHQKKMLRKKRKLDATMKWFMVEEKEIHNSIAAGFELAVVNGPLLGESIWGACFIMDEIEVIDPAAKRFLTKQKQEYEGIIPNETKFVSRDEVNQETSEEKEESKIEENKADKTSQSEEEITYGWYSDTYGPITGQLMALIQRLCTKGFLYAEPRIVEGMYKWELQVNSENLGKIYAVIGKHRAKKLEEELQESSELFLLKILVPVYDSFSFCDQIRERECGIPHPQLVFYGWEINDMDPFQISLTEEQLEEFGDKELPSNQVKQIIDKIRKRKGLPIEKILVADGTKQNTLSKKK